MQKKILDEGMTLYAHAQANGLTSITDGRINPDELQGTKIAQFNDMRIKEKTWCSGNPAFGVEQQLALLTAAGKAFNKGAATFVVADAETFCLYACGDDKHA